MSSYSLLIDLLFAILIESQNDGKTFIETKNLIIQKIIEYGRSTKDFFEWLKGHHTQSKSVLFLGILHYYDVGSDGNHSEGFMCFLKTANTHPIAQVYLSRCYSRKFGTDMNHDLAFHLIHGAAQNGSPAAQNELGYAYENAENGLSVAMKNLATCYKNGEGTEKNLEKSLYWNQKAAESGSVSAQINLALAYKNGEGVEKDLEKAFHWYKEASENDHEIAMLNLSIAAYWCQKVAEIENDTQDYVTFYHKDSEIMETECENDPITSFENDEIIDENEEIALQWYQKAARKGSSKAKNSLGLMYEN
ncbi:15082_t:CDS:2, partial [Funneliformis geosporum]